MFINSDELNHAYRTKHSGWFTAISKHQRKRLNILMNGDEPEGKWSYDEDNRKKVPKQLLGTIPLLPTVQAKDR